jgi:hypothetical protein
MWGRGVVVAAAMLAAAAGAQAQQDVNYFYCYVPVAQASTVYMSQTLPVGPVAERARYGSDYVGYLRSQGLVNGPAQGYCVMRPTAGEIETAQNVLRRDSCMYCAGASKFETVNWPRNGAVATPAKPPQETAKAPSPPPPAPDVSNKPEEEPIEVVVMGNTITGEVIVEVGGKDVERIVGDKLKETLPAEGWTRVRVSRDYGYGMALCVDNGDGVQFFTTQGHETISEAARAVFQKAKAAAKGDNKPFVCGKPWLVPTAEQRAWMTKEPDFNAIDLVKGLIRDMVICDEKEELEGECERPKQKPSRPVGSVRG